MTGTRISTRVSQSDTVRDFDLERYKTIESLLQ